MWCGKVKYSIEDSVGYNTERKHGLIDLTDNTDTYIYREREGERQR